MGRLQTKKQINYILAKIGANGLTGIAVSASTAAGALETLTGVPPEISQRFVNELRRQHLVLFTPKDMSIRLQLTVKGIHRLQLSEITTLTIPTPATWDRHWRMVVFDIPSSHKNQRYVFVSQLRRLGFVMVRQSTWYHPYPCFEVVDELVRYASLSQYVTTAEVVRLDASTQRKLLYAFPELAG